MRAAPIIPYTTQLAIVPARGARLQSDGTIDRWQVKIIDEAIKEILVFEIHGTFADLHNRELVFRTTACPAARYLYFHYLVAVLRARKHGRKLHRPYKPDNSEDMQNIEPPTPWATPGPYIRERMLRALIAEAGHVVFKEREISDVAIPESRPASVEELAIAAQLLIGDTVEPNEDDEEEDEEMDA